MLPNKLARVGTAVPCLPSMKAPCGYSPDLLAILKIAECSYTCCACYSANLMIASAIFQMEIGGNRRLVYPQANRTGAVNGGASRSS